MGRLRALPGYFRLYKRADIWYYWTYDEYGRRRRFSTGTSVKTRAWEMCRTRQIEGTLLYRYQPKKLSPTLASFGKDFWNYDTCPVIQDRIRRGGHFSRKMARSNQQIFDKHVAHSLGRLRLSDLTKANINSWLLDLPQKGKLSNKSANNVLNCLRRILDCAVDEGLVEKNFASEVKPLIVRNNRRGAFSLEQVQKLLASDWGNEYFNTAFHLGAMTGLRMGELQALTTQQIFPDHIVVNASWSAEGEGRKSTKSGYDRIVPIGSETYEKLCAIFPPKGGLIFTYNGDRPISQNTFSRALIKRMNEINGRLPDEETGTQGLFFDYLNKKEPLSFHSFRHFLNTRMIAADIPESKIQAIIGHESDSMTEHYAHLNVSDLQTFREIQRGIA